MELSENYKSFLGNFLRYFLVFSKIMFVNIKKSALKSGGLIFFALYLQCSPAQFLNLIDYGYRSWFH